MNSSYNVGEPQLRILKQELARGVEVCRDIGRGGAKWGALVAGSEFFEKFKYYVQVKRFRQITKTIDSFLSHSVCDDDGSRQHV
jgi:poly(A) polymerase Pap1